MGKSPGKWIKTVLFGKKSSKSNLSKDVTSEIKTSVTGKATSKDNGADSMVISSPVRPVIVSSGEHTELEKSSSASLMPGTADNLINSMESNAVNGDELIRLEQAARKVQAAFRGYLARRAFWALKGIIRLQALVRGHLVRRQAIATLSCMRAIIEFQARAHPRIVHSVTSSVCIHVLVDRNIVKIYSRLSEHSHPTGFGPGVKAKFHRVLLTAEGGVLKLTPASFIEIDSIIIDDNQCSSEHDTTSVKSVVGSTTSLSTGPAVIISEMMHSLDNKKMRLHCRVVSVYILVMEKNSEFLQSSKVNSCVNFPLAGFIIDDGSSSCCCWTDNKTALTLLDSQEWSPHKRSKSSLHKSNKRLKACSDTMSRLSDILNQNGRVVVKNHGSVSDSCLDAAISVDSDGALKDSDEQFLKALILQACSSNTWNVIGGVLDSEAVNQIEEQLQRLDMMMKLPLVNICASEVSHMDTLNEARSILQELLKSE